MTDKKFKIVFEPGCFDHLDVTQEQLDDIMSMLSELAESGELESASRELTDEDIEQMSDEEIDMLLNALNQEPRKLH